jgi:sensor histidine kinase YesM
LFNVLNHAASIAVSLPHEATRILLELSKSLRQQLYESDRKRIFTAYTEKTKLTFDKPNHLFTFLVEERYRWARHTLFIAVIFSCTFAVTSAVLSTNFLLVLSVMVLANGINLATIYFNIFVLVPRLLFKNKIARYIIVLCSIVFAITLMFESSMFFLKSSQVDFAKICNIVSTWSRTIFFIVVSTSIVIFQHWARNERYIAQLEAATMRAELEQLQNQINPHFLFNMLNNILVLIRENPSQAVVILHEMSDMMKYQFNVSAKKEVLLNDDIQFLTDYLNLEKIRRDHFEFTITAENNVEHLFLPPLLFIPFVENAVKHSKDATDLSYIWLHFGANGDILNFTCRNSKPFKPERVKNEFSGLGLANIRRRLDLLFEENYSLDIFEDETNFTVQLKINKL